VLKESVVQLCAVPPPHFQIHIPHLVTQSLSSSYELKVNLY
jgi:hypothetical protein